MEWAKRKRVSIFFIFYINFFVFVRSKKLENVFKNQIKACLIPLWVNIGIFIYVKYQKFFYGRDYKLCQNYPFCQNNYCQNYQCQTTNDSLGIDGISTCCLGCIGCFVYLNCLLLFILIVVGMTVLSRKSEFWVSITCPFTSETSIETYCS